MTVLVRFHCILKYNIQMRTLLFFGHIVGGALGPTYYTHKTVDERRNGRNGERARPRKSWIREEMGIDGMGSLEC